jgi:hypothetical protein
VFWILEVGLEIASRGYEVFGVDQCLPFGRHVGATGRVVSQRRPEAGAIPLVFRVLHVPVPDAIECPFFEEMEDAGIGAQLVVKFSLQVVRSPLAAINHGRLLSFLEVALA